jgi:O-antigen ligase
MAQARRTPKRQPHWFESRTTGDLLILIIAVTICFSVLAAGAAVFILAIVRPDMNTDPQVGAISDVINTLIGLLAGFLAGRTDAHMTISRSADGARTIDVDRSANARASVPADQ